MALQEFVDSTGVLWRVWEVVPTILTFVERRRDRRRKIIPLDYTGPERRRQPKDRRQGSSVRPDAWLTFESASEKRRFKPVPSNWADADNAQLEKWCRQAEPATAHLEWRDPLRPWK